MSFYRTLLAAVAAVVIASPVFAEDAPQAPAEGTATEAAQQSTASSDQAAPVEEKVNINKATAKDLMKLKGVNASKARALVACRDKQDGKVFKSVDDVAKCKKPKLKPEAWKALTDQLTVD